MGSADLIKFRQINLQSSTKSNKLGEVKHQNYTEVVGADTCVDDDGLLIYYFNFDPNYKLPRLTFRFYSLSFSGNSLMPSTYLSHENSVLSKTSLN